MTTRQTILTSDPAEAAAIIRGGGLVAFGTETVYGLGADATNAEAVAGVFAAKGRPSFDPLIVHLSDASELPRVVREWPAAAESLATTFWPGPLTIVAPKQPIVPDLVTSGLPDVAVRVPASETARTMIRLAGVPVAAPSANLFGRVSPTTAGHVLDQLDGRIDAVLDGGPCGVGVESTVVRFGGVTREQLEAVVGSVRVAADDERGEMQTHGSPGRLPSHYSPGVPVLLGDLTNATAGDGLLSFGRASDDWPGPVFVLSERGDLHEAAARLFAGLRSLAAAGVARIRVDPIPDKGLGAAINDRLRRSANA